MKGSCNRDKIKAPVALLQPPPMQTERWPICLTTARDRTRFALRCRQQRHVNELATARLVRMNGQRIATRLQRLLQRRRHLKRFIRRVESTALPDGLPVDEHLRCFIVKN